MENRFAVSDCQLKALLSNSCDYAFALCKRECFSRGLWKDVIWSKNCGCTVIWHLMYRAKRHEFTVKRRWVLAGKQKCGGLQHNAARSPTCTTHSSNATLAASHSEALDCISV